MAVMTKSVPPLRAVREARGLGLREVARAAGMDPSHLSKVERSTASLSVDALARLAVVLELKELSKLLAPYRREVTAIPTTARQGRKPRRVT